MRERRIALRKQLHVWITRLGTELCCIECVVAVVVIEMGRARGEHRIGVRGAGRVAQPQHATYFDAVWLRIFERFIALRVP
jgi:hypothetical protein